MTKVFITGGSGFIGSNLIPKLLEQDHEVYALTRYVSNRTPNYPKGVNVVYGDIRDYLLIQKQIKQIQPEVIVHLGAITPVAYSFEHPQEVTETNYIGTINLANANLQNPNLEKFVMAGCYDEKTRTYILGKGLVTYDKIEVGDNILSINTQNKEIKFKPVEKMIVKYYEGPMIHFKNKRVNILVTPNHNMLVTKGKDKYDFEPAEKTAKRKSFKLPFGRWKGLDKEFIDLNKFCKKSLQWNEHRLNKKIKTSDLFYLIGLYIGDGCSQLLKNEFIVRTGLTRKEYLKMAKNPKNGRFISLPENPVKKITYSSSIGLAIPSKDKSRKKVEEVLTRLGIKYHPQKDDTIYFAARQLSEIFDQCGHRSFEKRIPRWTLEYAPKYLEHLLQGILDSDGDRERIITTTSEKLIDDIVELCTKLGKTVGFTQYKQNSTNYCDHPRPAWDIFISRTIPTIQLKHTTYEQYKGIIWCPIVRDNHTLLIEREKRVVFCGNTSEEYGNQQDFPIKETAPLRPNQPYAISKVASDLYLQYLEQAYNFPVCVCRPFNTYGRLDNFNFVTESIIIQMFENKPKIYLGDPNPIRDFMYVEDHTDGYMAVIKAKVYPTAVNLCTGNGMSIKMLASKIARFFNYNGEILWSKTYQRPTEIKVLVGDNHLAKETLGWEPKYDLETALRDFVPKLVRELGEKRN